MPGFISPTRRTASLRTLAFRVPTSRTRVSWLARVSRWRARTESCSIHQLPVHAPAATPARPPVPETASVWRLLVPPTRTASSCSSTKATASRQSRALARTTRTAVRHICVRLAGKISRSRIARSHRGEGVSRLRPGRAHLHGTARRHQMRVHRRRQATLHQRRRHVRRAQRL